MTDDIKDLLNETVVKVGSDVEKKLNKIKPAKDNSKEIQSLQATVKAQTQLIEEMKENMKTLFEAINMIYKLQMDTMNSVESIGNNEQKINLRNTAFPAKK